ncbi:thioredoxin [Bellilinea caldifistulae]|uniref:thioredoxin n=1 Tax=Bellilinea caldifistulae TaxID=360411 RepID=UPI00078501A2|nr:thioredoxin [Bellilinea caldifistulae]GAP09864.1 thioredoxin [Bellilinea caldifistulae]
MTPEQFEQKVASARQPLVVEFWAPWCGPCKVMNPILKAASEKYRGQVELLKINADESPDLLRQLKVFSIPTLLVYREGKAVYRKVGAQPAAAIDNLFADLASGKIIQKSGPAPLDRFLRLGAGLVLLGIGITNQMNIGLVVMGGIVMFSAVYDRCPIYRAISSRVKTLFEKP